MKREMLARVNGGIERLLSREAFSSLARETVGEEKGGGRILVEW